MNDRVGALQRLVHDAPTVPGAPGTVLPEVKADEDIHPSKAYGGLWSRRDIAHMLELRPLKPTAVADAVEYSYLARVQWNAAAGFISLHY